MLQNDKIENFFFLLFVSRKFCSNIQKDTFAYKGNIIVSHSKFSYGIHSAFKQKESAYLIAAYWNKLNIRVEWMKYDIWNDNSSQ